MPEQRGHDAARAESWRELESGGEGWRVLESAGEGWRGLERAGEGWWGRGSER
ncbi:hypothetical protein B484DRAFT_452788 [Ochromonadaceae sp. CCMP2298]|nr:hypothetical protein B484DRAFT_452788 [Ochromonadaceae sp. CCMP2298]